MPVACCHQVGRVLFLVGLELGVALTGFRELVGEARPLGLESLQLGSLSARCLDLPTSLLEAAGIGPTAIELLC